MSAAIRGWVVSALAIAVAACSSPKIDLRPVAKSDVAAKKLLAASQQAHGAEKFRRIRSITVDYAGQWASVGPKFQPVLADTSFRGSSEETYDLSKRSVFQKHTGPAGEKSVLRSPGKIEVSYNGKTSNDSEAKRAAALVADAYTMFLLGPFYFDRAGITLITAGDDVVDQNVCDCILAVLKPGFGFANEDRVLLSIDRATKQLRRVRMTLNGLDSTIGAEVDVTFRNFRRIDGVLWPTDFDERIRVPFDLPAHHWRLVDLKTK